MPRSRRKRSGSKRDVAADAATARSLNTLKMRITVEKTVPRSFSGRWSTEVSMAIARAGSASRPGCATDELLQQRHRRVEVEAVDPVAHVEDGAVA